MSSIYPILEKQLNDLIKNVEKVKGEMMMEVAYGEKIKSTDDIERDHYFKISEKDNINPDHYKSETSLECIESMGIIFGEDAVLDFCLCNAWKYIWRWKNKNGNEDLEKAKWYLDRAYKMLDDADARMRIVKRMIHYVGQKGGKE